MPETLKKIGIIMGEREGKLIGKIDREISFSTKLYDKEGKQFGKISRIFGPVKSPYVAIESRGSKAYEIYMRWNDGGGREEKREERAPRGNNKVPRLQFDSSGKGLRERRTGMPGLRTRH
ncbi:MAG: hypothetical protein M1515_01910 [Candidatus Thermoplasmatota archaeon]|jgi:rRNA processing protein Gar1|nr:hypothetical protein [Candidatus Thermoplasmatota archaeon]